MLRLVLQLHGEVIERADAHIGFLHRGSEFLMESRTFVSNTVFIDRLDYTSVLTQTHAYCLAVERLCKVSTLNVKTTTARVLLDELSRLLNHLLAAAAHALDVGTMSPLF